MLLRNYFFPGWTVPVISSFLYDRCSNYFVEFEDLTMSFLCQWAWVQHCRCGLTTPQWRGRITSLNLVGNTLADATQGIAGFFCCRGTLLSSVQLGILIFLTRSLHTLTVSLFHLSHTSLLLPLACFIFMLKSSGSSCSSMQDPCLIVLLSGQTKAWRS